MQSIIKIPTTIFPKRAPILDDTAVVELQPLSVGRARTGTTRGMFVVNDHAWRCMWEEVEGSKRAPGGSTYALTQQYLEDFIKIFKDAVDPARPILENRVLKIELVQVTRDLFNEMITNTTGIVHVNVGLHKADYERN